MHKLLMLQSRKNYIIYDPIDVLKGNASIKLVFTPTQKKIEILKALFVSEAERIICVHHDITIYMI